MILPTQFTFRGVKFTLDKEYGYYRHKNVRGLKVSVTAWEDECRVELMVLDRNLNVAGEASARDPDPVKALEKACRNLAIHADKRVQQAKRDAAPVLKVARARRWV